MSLLLPSVSRYDPQPADHRVSLAPAPSHSRQAADLFDELIVNFVQTQELVACRSDFVSADAAGGVGVLPLIGRALAE